MLTESELAVAGRRCVVTTCQAFRKVGRRGMGGRMVQHQEPSGLAEYTVAWIKRVGAEAHITYINHGKRTVDRVPVANVVDVQFMN